MGVAVYVVADNGWVGIVGNDGGLMPWYIGQKIGFQEFKRYGIF